MKSCKTCKYNQPRTLQNKACLKRHMAVFGFGCRDFEPINEVDKYEIGQQVSIYDILDELERNE